MWGAANLGWMYYEIVLHSEPPSTSVVRFLFGLESVLLAMVLFLDQDKDSPRIDAESALDFVQIGIVFFFIYVEFYYLPARRLDDYSAFLREMRVENVEDAALTLLAALQALRAQKAAAAKGESASQTMIDTARVFINDAAERVEREARRAIAAIHEGDMLATQTAVLKRFAKRPPVDTIALRRRVAAAVQAQDRYPLEGR